MSKHHRTVRHERRRNTGGLRARIILSLTAVAIVLIVWSVGRRLDGAASATARASVAPAVAVLGGKIRFTDVGSQSKEFMRYASTIRLTAQQEAVKREVLEHMPAACCRNSNAHTCCCPCNLSKTVWGLTNYALAQHGASAEDLREVLKAWYEFTNPSGYSGDICYSGGCGRPFHENGCGGMREAHLAL